MLYRSARSVVNGPVSALYIGHEPQVFFSSNCKGILDVPNSHQRLFTKFWEQAALRFGQGWQKSKSFSFFLIAGGLGFFFLFLSPGVHRQVCWRCSIMSWLGSSPTYGWLGLFVLPCQVPPSPFIPPVTLRWANTVCSLVLTLLSSADFNSLVWNCAPNPAWWEEMSSLKKKTSYDVNRRAYEMFSIRVN